jgi:hypothetical protein
VASDGVSAVAQTSLCVPLQAGEAVSFSVDLSLSPVFSPFGSVYLQIWGALTQCSKDQLLWTSPLIEQFDTWTTHCGTMTPSQPYPFLVIAPSPDGAAPPSTPTVGGGGYLLLDNFGSKGSCN